LIAPNGPRKVNWDWYILILVFYTSVAVPYSLAFVEFTAWDISPVGFFFDIIIDICFISDVIISAKTTYYDREGTLVLDKVKVRKHYFRTWFWPDIVASFPFEYFVMLVTIGSGHEVSGAWRLPSLLKLLRIMRLGRKIDQLSSSKMFRIFQFTFMLLMAAHWYACLWFHMGNVQAPAPGEQPDFLPGWNGTSWQYRLDMNDENTMMQYTASLYWAITTLMKSPWFHPNSPNEFVAAAIMIIFGCVLYAYFIGSVTAVIQAANAAGGRYRGQVEALRGFCAGHGISAKTSAKLLTYQQAMWTETNSGTDRTAMLKGVPLHLHPKVTIEMYRTLMDACPFLYDCSSWCATTILQQLKVQVCDAGDELITAGAMLVNMYILVRGEVKINHDPEAPKQIAEAFVPGGRIGAKPKAQRKSNSAKDAMRGRTDKFGTLLGFQNCFQKNSPIDYSVNALSRCSLLTISRGQLKEILTTYDDDKETVLVAIEKANTAHRGGIRRSSTRLSRDGGTADLPEGKPEGAKPPEKKPEAAIAPSADKLADPAPDPPAPPAQPQPSSEGQESRDSSSGGGLFSGFFSPAPETDVGKLRSEVQSLRAETQSMAKQLAAQTKMIEELVAASKLKA